LNVHTGGEEKHRDNKKIKKEEKKAEREVYMAAFPI
jgi:hypothetical protein